MNYPFIAAGIVLFLAFVIHTIFGDKDYREINPGRGDAASVRPFQIWLMGRGTFQMVSVDLLLTAVAIFLMGINIIPYNYHLAGFIALLYLGYLAFWLLTLLFSKAKGVDYLRVGQWTIFLTAFVLIMAGIK